MPRLHGSNARSPVWNHYEKLEEKEDGSWTVKCVQCGRVTSYHSHKTGTASLRKHVKQDESKMKDDEQKDDTEALLKMLGIDATAKANCEIKDTRTSTGKE
ncbi:hypothetical protein RDI58_000750 [Solanum bulbocastanum]|uniref:BED-type domain-containing protein n=1 Tax=Solanum bulbocastanum TaxID=147425 RepID=A0AAN8YPG6_SOLBU